VLRVAVSIENGKTEPTPAGEPSQARVPAAKPSRRHVNTVVAGLAIVVLLVCSVFVYRNVSRPVLQFDGPEAIDLVPSPGRVCGSVYLVVNGNGRFVVESISLKLVSLPVSHDSMKVAGSLPTAMDLPPHFSVYVCISSVDIGKGSRLIVDVTGTWVLLGLSERAELHTETGLS